MRKSLLAPAALLAGCTAIADPDKIKPELPADAGAFCLAVRDALAGAQASCLGAEYGWTSEDPGLPDCGNWARASARGNAKFDGAAAFDCLTFLGQASCDGLLRVAAREIPAVCQRALQGQVTSQDCWDDVECAGDGYCNSAPGRCPGSCLLPASLDQDCSAQRCGPGLLCVNVSVAAVQLRCRPLRFAAAGDACGILPAGAVACTHGTFCGALGTCAARRTSGACAGHEQCAPGYRCAGPQAGARTCQPAVPERGACTAGSEQCVLGTYCAAGTCTFYPTAGGACDLAAPEPVDCKASTCVSGACVAPFVCRVP